MPGHNDSSIAVTDFAFLFRFLNLVPSTLGERQGNFLVLGRTNMPGSHALINGTTSSLPNCSISVTIRPSFPLRKPFVGRGAISCQKDLIAASQAVTSGVPS